MNVARLQTVLLDMGGVILQMAGGRGFPHSRLDWRGRQAMLQALTQRGGRASLESLDSLVFTPWRMDYERRVETGVESQWSRHLELLRSRCGGDIGDLELLESWFRPYGEKLVPTAGAKEALEELQKMGFDLALVSNVPLPGELYARVLRRFGLHAPFRSLCFSYDRGSRKPSPALLRMAMSELDAKPISTVMVGDRRDRDITAGRAAGTRTIWIQTAEDQGPEAEATIASVAALPDLLRAWQR